MNIPSAEPFRSARSLPQTKQSWSTSPSSQPLPGRGEHHPQRLPAKDAKVVLYDAIGQRQKVQSVQTGWNTVRLDGLPTGIYFYEIWEGASPEPASKAYWIWKLVKVGVTND
ncbi:MAG: T9SS type A sorting domain-containing protein [Saprospiraceae bacterium]